MKQLYTEQLIQAPTAVVWQVLTDFSKYRSWNKFIPDASGGLYLGSQLNIKIHPPSQSARKYKVELTEVEIEKKLTWLGHFYITYLIDGRHTVELKKISSSQTLVLHYENFTGLLVPFVWRSYITKFLLAGFHEMNLGLKTHAESIYTKPI